MVAIDSDERGSNFRLKIPYSIKFDIVCMSSCLCNVFENVMIPLA